MVLYLLTVLFGQLACTPSKDDSLDRIVDKGRIRIAMSAPYPPFSCYSVKQQLIGFDVDLSRELAKRMEVSLEIVVKDWSLIIDGLLAGEYDGILGSMAVTPERSERVNFSIPYYHSAVQVMTRLDSPAGRPSELKGKTFGINAGSNYFNDAAQLGIVDIRIYDTGYQVFEDVKEGLIEGTITDSIVGSYIIQNRFSELGFLGSPLRREKVAIAVRKQDRALLEWMDEFVEEIQQDGSLGRLIKKVARSKYPCD
jgi:polar amino acid transport system substrate-binding protein